MFRLMCWLGMKLLRASGATVHVLQPGQTYVPPPIVHFTVRSHDRGWEYRYTTEPVARAFVEAYYGNAYPGGPLTVTRFVNDREDAQVTVTPSTFAPALPLFPMEASAN